MAVLQFLDFTFDTENGELTRGGEEVTLQRKAKQVLAVLARNSGRIVTKDRLIEEIWDGRMISDDAIYSQIKALRRIIEPQVAKPSAIMTVHGQGFRFTPEVKGLAPARVSRSGQLGRSVIDHVEPDGPPVIAVMPLKWLGPASERSNLAKAIPDEIISGLQKTRYLSIIDRGSAFRFESHETPASELRGQLGADYGLSGSMEAWDDRCSFSFELTDLRDERIVWSDRFAGAPSDIHAIRHAAVLEVLANIDTVIPEREAKRLSEVAEDQLSAWELYHLGRSNVFAIKGKDLLTGLGRFERAMELDPGFARAQAGITFSLWSIAMVNLADQDRAGLHRRIAEETDKALQLDPRDPFVMIAAGRAMSSLGNVEASLDLLQQSVRTAPASAFAHLSLASVQALTGQYETAIGHSATAMQLSPLDPNFHHICALRALSLSGLGRFDEAVGWARRGVAFDSAPLAVLGITLLSMLKSGDDEGMDDIVAEILREYPGLTRETFTARFPIAVPEMREMMMEAFASKGLLS